MIWNEKVLKYLQRKTIEWITAKKKIKKNKNTSSEHLFYALNDVLEKNCIVANKICLGVISVHTSR